MLVVLPHFHQEIVDIPCIIQPVYTQMTTCLWASSKADLGSPPGNGKTVTGYMCTLHIDKPTLTNRPKQSMQLSLHSSFE